MERICELITPRATKESEIEKVSEGNYAGRVDGAVCLRETSVAVKDADADAAVLVEYPADEVGVKLGSG